MSSAQRPFGIVLHVREIASVVWFFFILYNEFCSYMYACVCSTKIDSAWRLGNIKATVEKIVRFDLAAMLARKYNIALILASNQTIFQAKLGMALIRIITRTALGFARVARANGMAK